MEAIDVLFVLHVHHFSRRRRIRHLLLSLSLSLSLSLAFAFAFSLLLFFSVRGIVFWKLLVFGFWLRGSGTGKFWYGYLLYIGDRDSEREMLKRNGKANQKTALFYFFIPFFCFPIIFFLYYYYYYILV